MIVPLSSQQMQAVQAFAEKELELFIETEQAASIGSLGVMEYCIECDTAEVWVTNCLSRHLLMAFGDVYGVRTD